MINPVDGVSVGGNHGASGDSFSMLIMKEARLAVKSYTNDTWGSGGVSGIQYLVSGYGSDVICHIPNIFV